MGRARSPSGLGSSERKPFRYERKSFYTNIAKIAKEVFRRFAAFAIFV